MTAPGSGKGKGLVEDKGRLVFRGRFMAGELLKNDGLGMERLDRFSREPCIRSGYKKTAGSGNPDVTVKEKVWVEWVAGGKAPADFNPTWCPCKPMLN